MDDNFLSEFSLLETRVLGVLVEKQRTVPDIYPLTLNALVSGCNQKSSRDPIMNASLADVRSALDNLKHKALVTETSGGRADRFSHHIERVLKIPSPSVALIAMLMLRGPQTAGELRINSERLHKFADISSVESFLEELTERQEGSLVVKLPRQPGSRENRWMHLLSGMPETYSDPATERREMHHAIECTVTESDFAELKSRVMHLETELAALKQMIEILSTQTNFPVKQ
ncbi:MAG: YceH family protein [Nitrosomonas sp.]|jgi:uncharacterized protein YceH (UPF0502 family)|nr:YceH family protein [Nitrosomonas sp.]